MTSRPAPNRRPLSSASSRASWSTRPPRAVLMKTAPGFIAPNCRGAEHAAPRSSVSGHVDRHDVRALAGARPARPRGPSPPGPRTRRDTDRTPRPASRCRRRSARRAARSGRTRRDRGPCRRARSPRGGCSSPWTGQPAAPTSALRTFLATSSISVTACSAVEIVGPSGVLQTAIPRMVAASTSMAS